MGDAEGYGEESSGLFDHGRCWDVDIDALFEDPDQQEGWLENELDRIETQLDRREKIYDTIVGELEWKIGLYADTPRSRRYHVAGHPRGGRAIEVYAPRRLRGAPG